jgi:DNA-binding response OmpR family regulator
MTARKPAGGMARVLLVVDRPLLVELLALTLSHGVSITRAVSIPSEIAATVVEWQPHLLILDMDLDGTQIIALVNSTLASGRLPIIGLTRRGDLKGKLAAFDAGVDDILSAPFVPEELLARVIAVLRRSSGPVVTFTPVIKIGELEIDIFNHTVRVGTVLVHLSTLEQSLLYVLAGHAGHVVTREEILDTLWGSDYVVESNVVDRQIRNLRRRLQDDWRKPRLIATVPGRGYRSCPPPLWRSYIDGLSPRHWSGSSSDRVQAGWETTDGLLAHQWVLELQGSEFEPVRDISVAMVSRNSDTSNGFCRKACAPRLSDCSAASRAADSTRMGMSARPSSTRWWARNAAPSMNGIMRSSTITSGRQP